MEHVLTMANLKLKPSLFTPRPVNHYTSRALLPYSNTGLKSFKGCRMGHSDTVSLWYVSLLINTRFRFFILE